MLWTPGPSSPIVPACTGLVSATAQMGGGQGLWGGPWSRIAALAGLSCQALPPSLLV